MYWKCPGCLPHTLVPGRQSCSCQNRWSLKKLYYYFIVNYLYNQKFVFPFLFHGRDTEKRLQYCAVCHTVICLKMKWLHEHMNHWSFVYGKNEAVPNIKCAIRAGPTFYDKCITRSLPLQEMTPSSYQMQLLWVQRERQRKSPWSAASSASSSHYGG